MAYSISVSGSSTVFLQGLSSGNTGRNPCAVICTIDNKLSDSDSILPHRGGIVYYMAHPFESTYHWGKGIRTAYLCEFYRLLTLGSGSGFAAIYYLQKDGVPYAKGTGITMLQFVFKKIAVMILGLMGFCICLVHHRPVRYCVSIRMP